MRVLCNNYALKVVQGAKYRKKESQLQIWICSQSENIATCYYNQGQSFPRIRFLYGELIRI